jgi:hypothetical protein
MLNYDDAEKLKAAGFTDWEIDQLSQSKTPSGQDQPPIDLNDKPWIATINSRREWRDIRADEGYNDSEINNAINRYYQRDPNRSPWDFLKAEYKPPQKMTSFKGTVLAKEKIGSLYEKSLRRKTSRMRKQEEENEFFEETLGETIKRLNQNK